jgi:hypothetical protein
MAVAGITKGDHQTQGTQYCNDLQRSGGNPFDAERFEQQYRQAYQLYGPTTTVAALTQLLYAVRGRTAELLDAEAFITVVASGADRTITVDIQKSTGGGAFATVMTSTIDITNATTVRTAVAGVVAAGGLSLVDGDILQAVVTVAGAAGAQAQGLLLMLTIRERADP